MTAGERYARDGYLCPVTALSPAEAAAFRSKLEAFEKAVPERAPMPHDRVRDQPGAVETTKSIPGPMSARACISSGP